MTQSEPREHFCTLFDANFLPMGLALYDSLIRHSPHAWLWVVCVDEITKRAIDTLSLPGLRAIALEEIETDALRAVRAQRTPREYYWTLTPWMFRTVFDRSDARRVTYLDADLYFFDSPTVLLDCLRDGQEVLLTHHAYAPEYDQTTTSGAYCVQFMTVTNAPEALRVIDRWRDQCLEWCSATFDGHRLGDQRYLDAWPETLGDRLVVINRADWTGAPWNATLAERRDGTRWTPVFYHFHGFRCLSGDRALLKPTVPAYHIGPKAWALYRAYVTAVTRWNRVLRRAGFGIAGVETPIGLEDYDPWATVLRRFGRLIKRRLKPITDRPIVSVR